MRVAHLLLVAWLASWLCACTSELPVTEIVLEVDSELSVPDELSRITLEIAGSVAPDEPAADLRERDLPRSISLVYEEGPIGPLRIRVSGWLGDVLVARKDVDAWFIKDASVKATVTLTRDCAAIFCSDGLTCEEGSCVPVPVLAPDGILQPVDAGGELDGGTPNLTARDAGLDGPPSLDAGADGAVENEGGQDDASTLTDAAVHDAAQRADAGSIDASALDASALDASVVDASALDASVVDASVVDASVVDASVVDANLVDARADTGAPLPGAPPVCTVQSPWNGDVFQVGTLVPLAASCVDPESGIVTAGVVWSSPLDGFLASGSTASAALRTIGTHHISVCAPDPRAAALIGCGFVDVSATWIAQPSARIVSITQAGSSGGSFAVGRPIHLQGTATGSAVTLTWSDSQQGALGTGTSVTLASPSAGRHVVTLRARDRYGVESTDTRDFLVVPPGPGGP